MGDEEGSAAITMLPGGEQAAIPPTKLAGYLLSETHPVGRSKAKFLRAVGFGETNTRHLAEGLLAIARWGTVVERVTSPHGVKYVVDGPLTTPLAGEVRLRTVWIVETDAEAPRFVTAYPSPDRGHREGGRNDC